MAGNVYGADVVELRSLSERMSRSAADLDRIASLLTHQISVTTAWVGPNAHRFRGEWSGSYRGSVASSARALRECSAALRRNADEQDRTSAADSSSAGLPGVGRPGAGGTVFDQSLVQWIQMTGLPSLEKTYDLLTKADGYAGLLTYVKRLRLPGVGLLGAITSAHDLALAGPETWDDIQSGNIFRFGKAIFRTGWTVAKAIPVVGLVDTAWSIGIDTGKMFSDIIMGPGSSDRAFTDVGQQIDKAGNDFNKAAETATKWVADRIWDGVKSVFHF
ncbi:MAG: hypothetical protein ABI903_00675 [Actinomycetota bacterium]